MDPGSDHLGLGQLEILEDIHFPLPRVVIQSRI